MTATQVHTVGTEVVIDRTAGTIGTKYPGESAPREVYSLDEEWVKPYTVCRVCGKPVDDAVLARAYWQHQAGVCGTACLQQETHKRYACCEKAVRTGCVCTYSTDCPDHGPRHFGTHD